MKVASAAAREITPPTDDVGLRTALRNVPLLPAPANVDDLLARLGTDEVPFSSGPLADLISDARYVEPAPPADDAFFAPVSLAANSNRRARLVRRLASGAFNATLVAAALLILWNALLPPDGAPSPTLAPELAGAAADGESAIPPTLTAAAHEAAPESRADNVGAASAPPPVAFELAQPVAAGETAALPEPVLDAGPEMAQLALDVEAPPASATLQALNSAAEPTPIPAASLPVPDAQPTEPSFAMPEPSEASTAVQPEPAGDAVAQPGAYAASDSAEPFESVREAKTAPTTENGVFALAPVPLPAEAVLIADAPAPSAAAATAEATEAGAIETPIRMAAATPSEGVAAAEAVAPAADDTFVSVAVDAASGAATAPEQAGQPEAEASADLRVPAPVTDALPPVRPALLAPRSAPATMAAEPAATIRTKTGERVPFAGIWAARTEACTPAMQEEGHLLARIGVRGGRAGDTSCAFRTITRKASAWRVNAACSDGEASWRSDVRLSLARGRLTWTSQKGSTTYLRCPRA